MSRNCVEDEVPLKYKGGIKASDLTYIKVTCKGASGEKIKEEIPIFDGEGGSEKYLLTVKRVNTVASRYGWFSTTPITRNAGTTTENVPFAYETMSRALMNSA